MLMSYITHDALAQNFMGKCFHIKQLKETIRFHSPILLSPSMKWLVLNAETPWGGISVMPRHIGQRNQRAAVTVVDF